MPSAVLKEFHHTPKRPLPPLSNGSLVNPLIADLHQNWHQLHDRALAVREIIHLGVSRRRLAREMGFSDGLLRHLLKALEAMPSDVELAGQNAISTNELVGRAKPGYIAPMNPTQTVFATPVPGRDGALDQVRSSGGGPNLDSSATECTIEPELQGLPGAERRHMLFQKAANSFRALAATHSSFSTPNLAQPVACSGTRRLRAPGEPGQRV